MELMRVVVRSPTVMITVVVPVVEAVFVRVVVWEVSVVATRLDGVGRVVVNVVVTGSEMMVTVVVSVVTEETIVAVSLTILTVLVTTTVVVVKVVVVVSSKTTFCDSTPRGPTCATHKAIPAAAH